MFLEGEVNWVLVLSVVAGVSLVVALVSTWYAVTHGAKHATASTELDTVQKSRDESDKRLFETLNAVPVALVQTDKQGKFVFANRAAHQLLGRRDAELIGLRFHSATWGITYPDGRPVPPDLLPSARALRGQTVKGFQHLLANPATRRKMLVSVTAMPIEDEWGQITGSIAAIVETDGLATPAEPPAPDAGSDLTRRVFEAASSALVVIGPSGEVREANATARAVLGRSEAPEGGDFFDLFLGEAERVEGRQALRAALAADAGEADPILARHGPSGAVQWRVLPLTEGSGRADAVLLAGERFSEAEAAQPAGTGGGADPERGASERSEFEALQARLAQAEAELEASRLAPPVQAAPLGEGEVPREVEQLRREIADREQALADARAEADAARRAAEQARAEVRAELDSARRLESVGRLTGGVAQDFNALLAVMTSALDLMLKQADDPGRVRRLGEAALAAGQRGEVLTRRLSAFSQGEDAPNQVLDAAVLLRGLEGKLRAIAGSDVDLLVEASAEPAMGRFDPQGFEGAVRALVQNAVEATEGRGSVAVRLETLPEGLLRLSVRDSGTGFHPALADRALEPFFTTKPGHAGLGLSQAHAFARQSGGRLTIDSRDGEGAEVAVVIPAV